MGTPYFLRDVVLSLLLASIGGLLLGLAGTLAGLAPLLGADPAPKVRQICDPSLPENAEVCIPDTFEVIFGSDKISGDSVLESSSFAPEMEIEVLIVTDTKSPRKVQGWSFGVEHDPAYLTILDATAGGTDADPFLQQCWVTTILDVDKCAEGDDWCGPPNRTKGAGLISATAMCFKGATLQLPVQRNSLCRAKYRLKEDPGCDGTVIGVTDRLAPPGTPPVDINISIDGRSKRWTEAVDGWIVKGCEGPIEERCFDGRDDDGDRKIDCEDIDCADDPSCRAPPPVTFRRADIDGNGRYNILDVMLSVQIVMAWIQPRFHCLDIIDADDDGMIDIMDLLPIIEWFFQDGPDLHPPFRECGLDPTPDALSCSESNCP